MTDIIGALGEKRVKKMARKSKRERNQAIREGIKQYANWPTIPQLYIHGEFIGGADIIKEMYETGELVKLLKANS